MNTTVGGARVRMDGRGDPWANSHRKWLGANHYMHDVDGIFGQIVFGQNTGDRLFLEYVPDNYVNRTSAIRRFAVVAYFDRKASRSFALSSMNSLSTAVYLHQARCAAMAQPKDKPPKFFFVCGSSEPPWEMIEIDIYTGEETGVSHFITEDAPFDWQTVWHALGLKELRQALKEWIDPN